MQGSSTTGVEASVWALMTRDVYRSAQDLGRVGLQPYAQSSVALRESEKYQIFEVVTAAIFARLKPEYSWSVSPNRPDGGVDFVGCGPFLKSEFLGIDASIIVGGECKKRSPANALDALRSSILKMCDTLHPTFVIGVVSAPLSPKRITATKDLLERQLRRHCHIFDRRQIEGLIADQIDLLADILNGALDTEAAKTVLDYFGSLRGSRLEARVDPSTVAAATGWPLCVPVQIRHVSPGCIVRVRWLGGDKDIRCISPSGADTPAGARIRLGANVTQPFSDDVNLELVTHAVGSHELGTIEITTEAGAKTKCVLPKADVALDFRPSFYAPPYQAAMDEISAALARTSAGRPTVVAVTGSGGGGKTRLCEEAAIEARRAGAGYVSAEQPNSNDRPYRLFANLLLALSPHRLGFESPSRGPIEALHRLQPDLADRASGMISSLVDSAGLASEDDQTLLSTFVLLISARSRNAPLVIHLQNLHWCSADALDLIDRVIWQLQQVASGGGGASAAKVPVRVMFLLEGRTHEQRAPVDAGWSTRAFEACLERIPNTSVACGAFTPRQSAEFVERLFEIPGSAARRVPDILLGVQRTVSEAIVRASGGNPFHILEQVKLLRQQGVLSVNPQTGLLYLVYPPVGDLELPEAVAETIHARWRYWASNAPDIGSLVLAAAMFEDRLPAALFNHLWRALAPHASKQDLEALELFKLADGIDAFSEFAFSHENYFHALHGLQPGTKERRKILRAYVDWFETNAVRDPELLFVWARAALQSDLAVPHRAEALLRNVVQISKEQNKLALTARATAALLDELSWPSIRHAAADIASLVAACHDELDLASHLITTGNRSLAVTRVERALGHLSRHRTGADGPWADALERSRLLLCAMRARVLFNNGEPVRAVAVTEDLVADAERFIPNPNDEDPERRLLLMEALHTHAVAAALAGNLPQALDASARATAIARTLHDHDERALDVISTHGNIMIVEDPHQALDILLACAQRARWADANGRLRLRLEINTAMAQIVIGYKFREKDREIAAAGLTAAGASLRATYRRANTVGRHADAAAAALLSGIAQTLLGQDARGQFAEAVASASRAGQLETLWRAQVNLAHSLSAAGESPLESAASALAILASTLESAAGHVLSFRFRMVAAPMAQAARYCIRAGDPRGAAALSRFPILSTLFADPERGELRDDLAGMNSREWLRVGDVDYVLY